MSFVIIQDRAQDTKPFEYILGTNAEAYLRGEIVTLTNGRLTEAGVDSTGTQKFLTVASQPAETTAITPIPVIRLDDSTEFETESSGIIAVTSIGDTFTLNAARDGVTTTTTNGVFEITDTDGLNPSKVTGFMRNINKA